MMLARQGAFPRFKPTEGVRMSSVDQAITAEAAMAGASAARVENRILGRIAVVIALLSAFATFLVLSDLTPIAPTHDIVVTLLLVSTATVLLLVGLIARELWLIVQARRRGRAAARLHVRIIALFSLIAAAPAILVAIVASVTLDRGLDRFFSTRTQVMMENSLAMADIYLREQGQNIRTQAVLMALDIGRAKPLFDQDRERFRQFLNVQAANRGLAAAQIIDGNLAVIEKAESKINLPITLPSRETLAQVDANEPEVRIFLDGSYVAAVTDLKNYDNLFLYVARPFDPGIAGRLRQTQENVVEYNTLQERRFGVQIAFALVYTVIALIVLLSAVWIGLNFANYLVAPIRRLIGAANLVSTGNLYVQVPIRRSEGDLAHLGETFNKMTQELRTQRDDIVRARDLIDSRRRFTEAVLAGASAGVIGVDAEGRVSILNRSAERLIGASEADTLGRPLADVVPELADMLDAARTGAQRLVQGQVTINRNGRERNLSVRVTSEQAAEAEHGYVITLDDITELVSAQRTSAWADVARRIAHEIKNPLTPIQLSAERLRRKYGKVITEDRDVFEQCTDTIVRQVEDIKRMVDEFSRFARTPKPVMVADDVADTIRQVVFLMKVGHSDIDIHVDIAEATLPARFDRRLISQALTNIVKNAAEGIAAVPTTELGRGRIHISAAREDGQIVIDVVDNGVGLPKENRSRLLEPYVTTREKGTGLGLAIVGRILEEHGGSIELRDASETIPGQRGAWVRLRFSSEVIRDAGDSVEIATSAAGGY
jgi:two-component system nitrogen regulation sensor histidine kinase NtrY